MEIGKEYLPVVIERFKSVKNLGDKTIDQLSEVICIGLIIVSLTVLPLLSSI